MNIMCVQRRFTSVTSARMMDECGFDTKMSLCVSVCRTSRCCRVSVHICAIVSDSRPYVKGTHDTEPVPTLQQSSKVLPVSCRKRHTGGKLGGLRCPPRPLTSTCQSHAHVNGSAKATFTV